LDLQLINDNVDFRAAFNIPIVPTADGIKSMLVKERPPNPFDDHITSVAEDLNFEMVKTFIDELSG
jgi:hypothetical protein